MSKSSYTLNRTGNAGNQVTSEQRKAIESKIGRGLTAQEIGQGSITRPQDKTLREKIAAANQQPPPPARWIETTLEHEGTKPNKENRKQAFVRLRGSQEQRADYAKAAAAHAAKLADDATYLRMNRIAEQALERARWDDSIPQSRWEDLLAMRDAAKADDRALYLKLNKQHVEYLESVTNEKQSAIDGEIARLHQVKKTLADDRFEEPLPTPEPGTYSHIRRASGQMQFVNKTDGHIVEYDPRVPHAMELAMDRLAQHQQETKDRYGESFTL